MLKEDVIPALIDIGWPKQEAEIYVFLLEVGAQPASIVASRMKRPRVTIYHALERMASKGIVTKRKTRDGWQFAALPPVAVRKHLEEIHARSARNNRLSLEQFSSLEPLLEKMQTVTFHKPAVEVFEGEEALQRIYELSLDTEKMYAYFEPWPRKKLSGLRAIDDWHTQERVRRSIPVQIILPDSEEAREFAAIRKPLKEAVVIPEKLFPFRDITIITDTRMLIYSLADGMGISIESKNMAANQKIQFQLAWEHAKQIGRLFVDSSQE